jgi:phage-related protein (TIGR01555 family)
MTFWQWLARVFCLDKPQPVEVVPLSRPPSFFTSDAEGTATRERVLQAVQERSLTITPASFRTYQGGVAMDSAGGSWGDNAKAMFQLSGSSIPDAQLLWFASQGFIGFQLCAILAQQWLIAKACLTPARDAIRNGYKVTINNGQGADATAILARLTRADKKYRLKQHCVELVNFQRVFGIRIALFKFERNDPNDPDNAKFYERPFNPDGITPGSYKGIAQIDPYWCVPELSPNAVRDPTAGDFYEPTYWVVQGKRYHKSHLVISRGPEVPDVLKPSYQFAGLSLVQRIYERVYAAERTANEAPQLALTKRAMVFYTDTEKALADESAFVSKLLKWTQYKDNHGVKVADKEGDKIEQVDTALGDFDSVVMSQYQLVAAIANVPATKLLGTTPKGFNSSGEYEEASYHEELEAIQSSDMQPLIERHNLAVMRSEIAPALGIAPVALAVEWNPSDAPTAEEEAKVQLTLAQRDAALVTAGAIDGHDIRARLAADPKSGYDAIDPANVPPPPPAPPAGGAGHPFGAKDGAEFTALDSADWDASTGQYAQAELITNQQFVDPDIVAQKIVAGDFQVQLSPEFQTATGKRYRVVIDGHHSLAAAIECGAVPDFVEANYDDSDYRNAVTHLPMAGRDDPSPIAG